MNTKAYIKVTPKGGKKSYVMPAGNASFYKAQGATVEEPTEEEVLNAFPELKKKQPKTAAEVSDKDAKIAELEAENAELRTRIDELDKKLAEMIAEAEEAVKDLEDKAAADAEEAEEAVKTKKSKK
jgi:regulator of replication initiation timing